MNRKNGLIAILSTAAILGTFGIWIRQLAVSFSNPGQVFARSFFATLIIILIVLFKRINPIRFARENLKFIVLFSIVFPLSLIAFTVSANLTKVTNSLFMLYVGSLASTAILGKLVFNEKFSAKHIFSLILVFAGLSFFVLPFDISTFNFGLVFGLLAGVLEGSSHTLRRLMKNMQREVIVFYQSFSGVVVASALLMFSSEGFIREFHLSSVFVAILFGFLLVAIGYLLAYGFANIDVNLGTIILATELFFAIVINAIFLREFPTVMELIGGTLIFLGAVITSLNLEKTHK